jgi:NADH:ubiquinone oxidoreductase subunit E
MNIARLLVLAGLLTETISTDAVFNDHIERVLKKYEPARQTELIDALEIVQRHGTKGVTVLDWADAMHKMHGTSVNLVEVLASIVDEFRFCVQVAGEKVRVADVTRLVWHEDELELQPHDAEVPPGL